jgi:NAD(P)H-dependent FMN reductase
MITIIAATDRSNSYSNRLATILSKKIEATGDQSQILDLSSIRPAMLSEGSYGDPGPEMEILEQKFIIDPDRLVFVVPEYNGGFPGILKYFIDLCKPPSFKGKKVCLLGLGAGRGGNLRGVEHLTGILHYLRCEVCSSKIYISSVQDFISIEGEMTDDFTDKLLNEQLADFMSF